MMEELTNQEMEEIDGGIGFIVAFGLGLVGAAAYYGADAIVKNSTGESIAEHVVDLMEGK